MTDRIPVSKIKITDAQFEWLDSIREEMGLTWRGLILKGEQRLLVSERPLLNPRFEDESEEDEDESEEEEKDESEVEVDQ